MEEIITILKKAYDEIYDISNWSEKELWLLKELSSIINKCEANV